MARNGDPEGSEGMLPRASSSENRPVLGGVQVFVGIFRCYAVVVAFFVALAETE